MKRSRPLALFLCFFILLSFFSLSVSASSDDNLIDSNLTNWDTDGLIQVDYDDSVKAYRFILRGEQVNNTYKYSYYGAIYHLSEFIGNHNYSFKFKLRYPKDGQLTHGNTFEKYLDAGYFYVGLASYVGGELTLVSDYTLTVTKENYTDIFDKLNTINLNVDGVVNPCLFIGYYSVTDFVDTFFYEPLTFYVSDVALIDNTASDEKGFFDNLFQFFHDLKWEVIGGSCGDSGCSKNPHSSLADKISVKFNEALDSLKWFFHDLNWDLIGGSCGDPKCIKKNHISFADTITDNISNFFSGFLNCILYFNWEGDYTNPFETEDSPIDEVSAYFDDLTEYVNSIGTSIENVLDSITGGIHIFDVFTERFPWLKGVSVFCLAIIVITRFIGL